MHKNASHQSSTSPVQSEEADFSPLCAQIELFERAARFPGRPRERLVALGEAEELYFRLYPHHYRALQTIRIASQLGKVVGADKDPTARCESRLLAIVMGVITDAIQDGDLNLGRDLEAGELAFTVWALSFGTRALMDTRVAAHQLGVREGFRLSSRMTQLLLDALGWRPLLSEWDYARTRSRVRRELFADEWARALAASAAPCELDMTKASWGV